MNNDLHRLGKHLPRAKPVTLTFYDALKTYRFTTTFFVRDDIPDEQVQPLIQTVCALSRCALGKYKIGYQEFVVPDYRSRLEGDANHVMGTMKWVIKYHTERWSPRSYTIPGRNYETSLSVSKGLQIPRIGKKPDAEHPKWQAFLSIFKSICVSKEGEAIHGEITLDYRNGNWPPKGAKKRR